MIIVQHMQNKLAAELHTFVSVSLYENMRGQRDNFVKLILPSKTWK